MRIASPAAEDNLLDLIPEHCPDLLALLDVNGLFLYVNAAHYLRLGRSPESLIGTSIFDSIHPDEVPGFDKVITSHPVRRTPFRLNARWRKEEGGTARFESIGKWIPADEGKSHYLLLCSREVLAKSEAVISGEEMAELRAAALKLLARAEGEKTGVARAIHDDLGQRLTALSLELSLWKMEIGQGQSLSVNSVREKLAVLGELMNGMIGATRSITATLRPRVLEEFGLAAALEWHLEKVAKQMDVACTFTSEGQKLKFDSFQAAQIFRVADEIVASRIEAGCKHLHVRLMVQEKAAALVFEDANQQRHLGPEVCARIRLLGGEIEINDEERMIVVALPNKIGG